MSSDLATKFAAVLRRTDFVERHEQAVRYKAKKRDETIALIPRWNERRARAREFKASARADLPRLIQMFSARAAECGVRVWTAATAHEANEIVLRISRSHGVERVAKSKSMTTEECGLNSFLEQHGISVTDTDLGERIVQMFEEPPSHIVTPCIHRSREEIGELFAQHGMCEPGETDPTRLTEAARRALRSLFLGADLGITGANFLVAETGTVVVIENEANSLLGTSLSRVHIVVAGIDKLIERIPQLATFLTVLPPSSTGQRLTTYATHYTGPLLASEAERAAGLGDHELHIVLLDNGRSGLVGTPAEEALACIRCGACLNVCPVYRRVGGHAYDWVYPGPIGTVLAPGLVGRDEWVKASSLCGACTEVCPVGIDLARHIHDWRGELRGQGRLANPLPPGMAFLLRKPALWRGSLSVLRRLGPVAAAVARRTRWAKQWSAGGARRLPEIPSQTFRQWWTARPAPVISPTVVPGSIPVPEQRTVVETRDLETQFVEALQEAGGELIGVDALPQLVATRRAAGVLTSLGVESGLAPVTKLDLDGVPWLAATARRRIAWPGTLWVDFDDLDSRAQLVLPEGLVLLVPAVELVGTLDEHYELMAADAMPRCGTFVTGPSKTADIEQALVFGAHGPRRLLVLPLP